MSIEDLGDKSEYFCSFFGAYLAAYSIKDAAIILHTPSGCQRRVNHIWTVHDNMGYVDRTFSTNLREDDVIFGASKKLKDVIKDVYDSLKPPLIVVITSCVPEIIGDDIELIINSIKKDIRSDILCVSAAGFTGDLIDGFSKSLEVFAEKLVDERHTQQNNYVNLLGYMFDRYESDQIANVNELKRLVSLLGLKTNSVFLEGGSTKKLKGASSSKYNIVFPYGGPSAKVLKRRFNQENIYVELPIGIELTKEFLLRIGKYSKKLDLAEKVIDRELSDIIPRVHIAVDHVYGRKVALFADPMKIIGLTRLVCEIGMEPVIVGVTKKQDDVKDNIKKILEEESSGLYNPDILIDPDRKQVKEYLKEIAVDLIMGSFVEVWDGETLGIPGIRVTFPMFDQRSLFPRTILGFKGVLNLSEQITNIFNKEPIKKLDTGYKIERIKKDKGWFVNYEGD